MRIATNDACPPPEDSVLAEHAAAMDDIGEWGWILDRDWRLVYMSDQHRLSFGAGAEMVPVAIDTHLFSNEMVEMMTGYRAGPTGVASWRELFRSIGGLNLADIGAGGKDTLRGLIDPRLTDVLDELDPVKADIVTHVQNAHGIQSQTTIEGTTRRIRDATGEIRGVSLQYKPALGMNVLGAMAFERDVAHLARMQSVARAKRRPAAILFGDLEGSSALSRTLSTGNYFSLVRRIIRAADQCIVDAGGLVGRHVGDGVVAFFPVQSFESESGAAHACIAAASSIRTAMVDVAARSDLVARDLVVRFGLHWGTTLYMGNISTAARAEVTALGDEVNEAARIEACATGGRILASKPLVERLSDDDAADLNIGLGSVTYTQLADLDTATDKARRDAPAIAVCEL
jgi:class 3 adenylate cyclase